MRKISADMYLSSNAAYICTENAVIESMNSPAIAFGRFAKGDSLMECMSSEDRLRYEMMWEAVCEKPPITAVLKNCGGDLYASFCFEQLLGKRFCIAVISDTALPENTVLTQEENGVCPVNAMTAKVIEALADIPADRFGACDKACMYKMSSVTKRIVRDISKMKQYFDCRVTFSFPRTFPAGCIGFSPENFIRCISIVMYLADEISGDREVSVKLGWNGKAPRVEVSVRVDRRKFPVPTFSSIENRRNPVSVGHSLCEFCAGCAGYKYSAVDFPGEVKFILERNRDGFSEVELKCRNSLRDYNKYLLSARNIIEFLAAQENNEQ